MISYFDYYQLDYDKLYAKAKEHKFCNELVQDEYFLGLERARKKVYQNLSLEDLDVSINPHPVGSEIWLKEEIRLCKKNILYFCRHLKIKDQTEGFLNYNPYLYQQNYYYEFMRSKYIISDKCRQVGFSIATQALLLHKLLFFKDQLIEIISTDDEVSKSFLEKLKGTYDNLPEWFRRIPHFGSVPPTNAHRLSLGNGSSVKSLPRKEEGSRSGSLSILVFDEAAFIEGMKKMWAGSYYAIAKSDKSKVIIISTRNGNMGKGEWYYNMLTQTEEGNTDFNLIGVDWWEVPEYITNPAWLDGAFKNTARDIFLQEVCKKWLVAGDTVLDKEKLLNYKVIDPISHSIVSYETKKTEVLNDLHIFKQPKEGGRYAITADCGAGSKSYSSFHVFDLETYEQVAEYKKKMDTPDYATVLVKVGYYYGLATLVIEINNPGLAVMSHIFKTLKYPTSHIYKRKRKQAAYRDYGWVTSTKTRPLLVNDLIDCFQNDRVKINSKRTIDELLCFIWEDRTGKAKASAGANDDLVIALGIYCHLREVLMDLGQSVFSVRPLKDDQKLVEEKVWKLFQESEIVSFYNDNYDLFSEKTQKKIKDNLTIDESDSMFAPLIPILRYDDEDDENWTDVKT